MFTRRKGGKHVTDAKTIDLNGKKTAVLVSVFMLLFFHLSGTMVEASGVDESLYSWEIVEDGVAITGYTGIDSHVVIPATLGGSSVVSVGIEGSYGAFESHEEIEELVCPAGLKRICDEVFWGCSGITKLWLPQSLMSIGARAFQGCSRITDIYYAGTRQQWQNVYIDTYLYGNEEILNATVHYESVYEPQPDWSGVFRSSDGQEITILTVNESNIEIEFYGYSEDGWYSQRLTLIRDSGSDTIARYPVTNTLGNQTGEDVYTLEGDTIKVDSQSFKNGVYQKGHPESPLDPTETFTDEQVLSLRKALQIPDESEAACIVNTADRTYWEGAGISLVWVEFRSPDGRIIASCYADLSSGQAAREITACTDVP